MEFKFTCGIYFFTQATKNPTGVILTITTSRIIMPFTKVDSMRPLLEKKLYLHVMFLEKILNGYH